MPMTINTLKREWTHPVKFMNLSACNSSMKHTQTHAYTSAALTLLYRHASKEGMNLYVYINQNNIFPKTKTTFQATLTKMLSPYSLIIPFLGNSTKPLSIYVTRIPTIKIINKMLIV